MMETLRAVFIRDLKIAFRAGGGAGLGVVFFLALITVVPFAVGPDMPLLARIGPAILWIGALLATLLGLDRIFSADREDGSLDVMMLSATPLELIAAAKGAAKVRPNRRSKPPPRPKPRPRRDALAAAEAAIEDAEARHGEALKEIAAREAKLARERKALETKQSRERERLEARRDKAETAYEAAMRRWREG